jgi:hypothetical protein
VAFVALAPPAAADPAGPTYDRSAVVSIRPPDPSVRAQVVGGDAFLQLTVARGHEVIVRGYAGEPYLRIGRDGTVAENVRSPATYLDQNRYAEVRLPRQADPGAPPRWRTIGAGGTWAWHDHRTHWMSDQRPLGLGPGDRVVDATVPLTVDGRTVRVRVISTWMPPPSPLVAVVGVAVGLVAVLLAARSARVRPTAATLLAAAVAAALVGGWEYASIPPPAGPRPVWLLLPVAAMAAAAWAAVRPADRHGVPLLASAAALVAWAWERLAGLWRSVLPTEGPWWLDRSVTALAAAVALATMVLGLAELVRDLRRSTPQPAAGRQVPGAASSAPVRAGPNR